MKPKRIQRQRTKGWRMPANTVSVTRPGKWGNPFIIINEEGFPWVTDSRDPSMPVLNMNRAAEAIGGTEFKRDMTWDEADRAVVALYRQHCIDTLPDLTPLRGKDLACWCKPGAPCHADVLLELANA
jgi:hypothetical protein